MKIKNSIVMKKTTEKESYLSRSLRYSLSEMKEFAFKKFALNGVRSLSLAQFSYNIPFRQILKNPNLRFNLKTKSVLVVLHIQKTGGTIFENFITLNLITNESCKCNKTHYRNKHGNVLTKINHCNCYRSLQKPETWIFSRYTVGWPCGVHSDFTELFVSGCVDHVLDKLEKNEKKRQYYYTTILRDPIERFFSEFRHVNRGATWIKSVHFCDGKITPPDILPSCFDPEIGWKNVSLKEFLMCPFNMAFNRQTRMLADLTLVDCYNSTSMDLRIKQRLMLESAKHNLRNFAYFAIKERWQESIYLFEKTFNIKSNGMFKIKNKKKEKIVINKSEWNLVIKLNWLDIELYEYAKQLFDKRLKHAKFL